MKVVKIIGSLAFGGVEKVFEISARYNNRERAELLFIAIGCGGAAESAIRGLGYRVEVLNGDVRIPNLKLVWMLYSILRKERPDVVHTASAEANFHGLIAAYIAGVPVRIAEEIGIPAHSRLAQRVFRFCYRLSTDVIVISRAVGDYCMRTGEVPASKIRVIYNPVDPTSFGEVQKEREDGVFRILCVSRLHPIKNLDFLIRGFTEVVKEYKGTAELWLIGDGPERAMLEQLVDTVGMKQRISFLGYQENPAPFFSGTSLFVLPSLSEGQGVALMEAMLTSTPCIITSVGGAPEFIEDKVNGWLMDPYDLPAFARMLREIMAMPERDRQQVAERGRQVVLDRFMPGRYMMSIYQLYHGKN